MPMLTNALESTLLHGFPLDFAASFFGLHFHPAHEMRGPTVMERGGVSMAGGREGQGARKGNGVRGHRLPSPSCFVQNLLMYFGFLSR